MNVLQSEIIMITAPDISRKFFSVLTLMLAGSVSLEAKWSVYGDGVLHSGSSYNFKTSGNYDAKKETGYESNFWGVTTLNGSPNEEADWWVASSSTSPWDNYVNGLDTQPSMMIHGDVCEGDVIMAGLNFQYELADYTSEFRMANNVFGAGTDFYFGINASPDTIFARDGATEVLLAGGNISNIQNLTYQGESVGLGNGTSDLDHVPDEHFAYAYSYDWVHFTSVDGGPVDNDAKDPTDDIIFSIKDSGGGPISMFQWVVFIVVGDVDGSGTVGDSCINNNINETGDGADGSWGPVPVSGQVAGRTDDIVFSWTVDGKGGYVLDPLTSLPKENPAYDPNDPTIIPEPSNSILVALSMGLFLCRRNRK